MCRNKALEQLLNKTDKLYESVKNVSENARKCTLEGLELAITHLIAETDKVNKILEELEYQKEYRDGK